LGYIAVMDVAMEGKNTALLTLLILIQFAEMKSAVLKELTQEKLWAICYNGKRLVWGFLQTLNQPTS
jgi:hypothetical protein